MDQPTATSRRPRRCSRRRPASRTCWPGCSTPSPSRLRGVQPGRPRRDGRFRARPGAAYGAVQRRHRRHARAARPGRLVDDVSGARPRTCPAPSADRRPNPEFVTRGRPGHRRRRAAVGGSAAGPTALDEPTLRAHLAVDAGLAATGIAPPARRGGAAGRLSDAAELVLRRAPTTRRCCPWCCRGTARTDPDVGDRLTVRIPLRLCTRSGRLVFVQDPGLVVFHARTPFDKEYTSYRDDVTRDMAYLGRKWPGPPVD